MVYIEYSLSCEKVKFLHLTRLGFYSFRHVSFMHVKNKTSKYMTQLIVNFIFLIKETNHISAKLSEGLYQTNRSLVHKEQGKTINRLNRLQLSHFPKTINVCKRLHLLPTVSGSFFHCCMLIRILLFT